MRSKLMLLICFLVFSSAYSQNETINVYTPQSKSLQDFEWTNNRVGFTYSMMTGYGLTYLRHFDNGLALKTQLFAYGSIDDNSSSSSEIDVAFGLEVQYTIKKFNKTRFYILGGGYYNYELMTDNWNGVDDDRTEAMKNIGIGVGFEFLAFNQLSFAIDGGYYGEFTKKTSNNINYIEGKPILIPVETNPIQFGFGFGISGYFNF